MSQLEDLIARSLDGELTSVERLRLHTLLRRSAEARALYAESLRLRASARQTPDLHHPSAATEAALFARLAEAGYLGQSPATPPTPLWRRRSMMVGSGSLVAALLVVAAGWWFSGSASTDTIPAPHVVAWLQPDGIAAPDLSLPRARSTSRHPGTVPSPRPLAQAVHIARTAHLPLPIPADLSVPEPADFQKRTDAGSLPYADVKVAPRSPELPALPMEQPSEPLVPMARAATGGSGGLFAGLHGGMTEIGRGSGLAARDLQARVGLELGGGQRLSVMVGTSPSVTETRHTSTSIMMSAAGSKDGRRLSAAQAPPEEQIAVREEVWLGVGIDQPVAQVAGVSVRVGALLGSSRSTYRLGGEVTLSRRLASNVALEVAGSATQYLPHEEGISEFTVLDSPDHIVYNGVTQKPSFYAVGLRAGLRVEL